MLTEEQQQRLKSVSRGQNHIMFGVMNQELDDVIDDVMRQNPSAYYAKHELKDRNFYNEPRSSVEYNSFVIPCVRFAHTN
jgi:hypothetical protein